jgi:hypothetical protein
LVTVGKHVNNMRAIATQLLGKQVPSEMNTHSTKEELTFLCNGGANTPLQQ